MLMAEQSVGKNAARAGEHQPHHTGPEQDALAEFPPLGPEIAPVERARAQWIDAGPHESAAHQVVEPIQGQIGERVAHQGSGGGQQLIAPHQLRQPHAQHHLQPEERIATAEHPCRQSPCPLARCPLLTPQPGDSPSDSDATEVKQSVHRPC